MMLILAMLEITCSYTTLTNGSLANSRRFESLREPKIEFQLVFLRWYLISSFTLEILNVADLFRSLLPRGLACSLSVHHVAVACRLSEAETEPCPPALSIPTPSLAFWSLLALSTAVLAMAAMAGQSSLPPPPFPAFGLLRVLPRAPPLSPCRAELAAPFPQLSPPP